MKNQRSDKKSYRNLQKRNGKMPQKIALFGGSFNPIHNGHLALASLAVSYLQLHTLYFIPTADHPFSKESLQTPFKERMAMLEAALEDFPEMDIYDGESKREGPSYALTTIREFRELYPDAELFYIIGSDNIADFHKWYHYEELLSEAQLLITSRPGYSVEIPEYMKKYNPIFLPSPEWALSSSRVRDYLSKGYTCTGLIPDKTLTYIANNSIFQ